MERPAGRGREDDDARRAPGPALRKIGDRAEDRRRSARGLDPLELLVGSESEKAAVGRPERVLGAVRSRERLRLRGIQRSDVEPHLPVGSAGREGELPSVRREDRRARLRRVHDEDRTLGRVDRRAVDALLGGASAQRERPCRGRERGRNRPRRDREKTSCSLSHDSSVPRFDLQWGLDAACFSSKVNERSPPAPPALTRLAAFCNSSSSILASAMSWSRSRASRLRHFLRISLTFSGVPAGNAAQSGLP